MSKHEESEKSVKFIVKNCKDRFKLYITTTCIRISEAVTRTCSVKKGVHKNFARFTGKHLCQNLVFISSIFCYF